MAKTRNNNGSAKWTIISTSTLLLMSLLSLMSGNPEALTFDSNTFLDSDLGNVNHLDIGAQGTGVDIPVFVVYEKMWSGVDSHIMFKRSDDGGSTFSFSYDFLSNKTSGNQQKLPAMAYNNDTIVIAYLDTQWQTLPTSKYLIRIGISNDTGENWMMYNVTSPHLGGYPNNKMTNPDICIDPSGNIFAVWSEDSKTMISYSLDKGQNWSDPQKVKEHSNPDLPSYSQFYPSVASNGNSVVVAWHANPDYKEWVFTTKTSTTSLPGTLSFSEPELIPEYHYPHPESFYPQLIADSSAIHVAWWDFSTDSSGSNNEDITKDRPCIKYSKSTDGGNNFTINGTNGLIVNSSTPDGWHSPGDLSVNDNGSIAVVWYDYTAGMDEPAVRVSTSDDGINWSDPWKASDYATDIEIRDPRVVIDSNGVVYTAWFSHNDDGTHWNLTCTRSIINTVPDPVKNLKVIFFDKMNGTINWDINTEPDFHEYRMHLSTVQGFSPSASTMVGSSSDQGLDRYTYSSLAPNTTYYAVVQVVDDGGLKANSIEVNFTTQKSNHAPKFLKAPGPICMEEDSILESAINLTDLLYKGFVWDDNYQSQTAVLGLEYDIEFESEDPNVTAVKRTIPSDPPSKVLDLRTNEKNWYGVERARLTVRDAGYDWAFFTPDDLTNTSDWFEIIVEEINDPPTWSYFEDGKTGYKIYPQTGQINLTIEEGEIFCREDSPYTFSLSALDVDNDFLTYTCDDSRVNIKPDLTKAGSVSIFSFTPENRDSPSMDLNITAGDDRGGVINISIILPVTNINDPPVFESINGLDIIDPDNGIVFNITEGGKLRFQVIGSDIDPDDDLTLKSDNERIGIDTVSEGVWNVSLSAGEDESGSIGFTLTLQDLDRTGTSLGVTVNIINVQDRPEWMENTEKIYVSAFTDLTDYNDWDDPEETAPRPEWGEPVRIKANAVDPDGDVLVHSWKITGENGGDPDIVFGSEIEYSFLPSDNNLSRIQNERFVINLTINDGHTEPIFHQFMLTIWSDSDNDNDGLPDSREIYFFGDLNNGPEDDPDNDGATNIQEIGFNIPRDQNEIDTGIPDVKVMDPTKGPDDTPPPLPPTPDDDPKIPGWAWWFGAVCILIVICGIAAVIGITRNAAIKDRLEEDDIERRVQEMEERQKEIQGLYGNISTAGEEFGPDQSTLEDLRIDLGGAVYHSEGEKGLIPSLDEDVPGVDDSVEGGPLFDKTASGPVMGKALEIEKIDEE